jgi:hypothetical protein
MEIHVDASHCRGKSVDGLKLAQWAVSIGAAVGIAAIPMFPLLDVALRAPAVPAEDPFEELTWTSLSTLPTLRLAPVEVSEPTAPAAAPAPEVRRARPSPPELPAPTSPVVTEEDDGLADAGEETPQSRRRKRLGARRRTHAAAAPEPCPELHPDIAQQEEYAFVVERDLLEYYAHHLLELESLARVATHEDNSGEKDGFRLGIKRCSLLYQAGFRTGDVVHSVNDRRIVNVVQAVGAYMALRKQPELVVAVTRKGKPLQFTYAIHKEERSQRHERTRRSWR